MLLSLQQQRGVKMGAGEGTKKDSELEDHGRRLGGHREEQEGEAGVGQGEGGEEPGIPGHGTCLLGCRGPGMWRVCSGAVGIMLGNGLA